MITNCPFCFSFSFAKKKNKSLSRASKMITIFQDFLTGFSIGFLFFELKNLVTDRLRKVKYAQPVGKDDSGNQIEGQEDNEENLDKNSSNRSETDSDDNSQDSDSSSDSTDDRDSTDDKKISFNRFLLENNKIAKFQVNFYTDSSNHVMSEREKSEKMNTEVDDGGSHAMPECRKHVKKNTEAERGNLIELISEDEDCQIDGESTMPECKKHVKFQDKDLKIDGVTHMLRCEKRMQLDPEAEEFTTYDASSNSSASTASVEEKMDQTEETLQVEKNCVFFDVINNIDKRDEPNVAEENCAFDDNNGDFGKRDEANFDEQNCDFDHSDVAFGKCQEPNVTEPEANKSHESEKTWETWEPWIDNHDYPKPENVDRKVPDLIESLKLDEGEQGLISKAIKEKWNENTIFCIVSAVPFFSDDKKERFREYSAVLLEGNVVKAETTDLFVGSSETDNAKTKFANLGITSKFGYSDGYNFHNSREKIKGAMYFYLNEAAVLNKEFVVLSTDYKLMVMLKKGMSIKNLFYYKDLFPDKSKAPGPCQLRQLTNKNPLSFCASHGRKIDYGNCTTKDRSPIDRFPCVKEESLGLLKFCLHFSNYDRLEYGKL